jgi:alanine racemase
MSRPLTIHIDLNALRHNVQCVRSYAKGKKILAMIKANAYGHGLIPIANALQTQVEGFGVSCLEEANLLREANIQNKIVLMEGFFAQEELATISHLQLDCVIHTAHQVQLLQRSSINQPITIWLKVNSGMNRLGFKPTEVKHIWKTLKQCSNVSDIHLMTHFASADYLDRETTLAQMQRFQEATRDLPGERSLANSAAILQWPQTHADWVRPGLMLYGVSPFTQPHQLQPVMTVSSKIIAIHSVDANDKIGYGETSTIPTPRLIGIIAAGYGDGYPYPMISGTPLRLNGQFVPIIGAVAMDMLCVDLKTQPHAQVGDRVILWGKGLPLETIAQATKRFSYELLCGINRGQLFRTQITVNE